MPESDVSHPQRRKAPVKRSKSSKDQGAPSAVQGPEQKAVKGAAKEGGAVVRVTIDMVAQNMGAFMGVIQREPEIADRVSLGVPARVLNFDVPVKTVSHDGRVFTAYVKCSVWEEEAIAKLSPIVGRAWEKAIPLVVIGTVEAGAYRLPRPPYKHIGIMKCKAVEVKLLEHEEETPKPVRMAGGKAKQPSGPVGHPHQAAVAAGAVPSQQAGAPTGASPGKGTAPPEPAKKAQGAGKAAEAAPQGKGTAPHRRAAPRKSK